MKCILLELFFSQLRWCDFSLGGHPPTNSVCQKCWEHLGVSLESMPEVPEVHVPYLCTEWVNDVVWWKTSWKNCFPVTQFSNGNLPFLGGGNSNIFGIFTPDPWVVHHPI